jgi:probable phosphoglycerate mutase
MEKHIYFVRHGESDSNKDGLLRAEDSLLTDRGHEQAELVAERIERINVEALVVSNYKRTLETAHHISERIHLPIEKSDLFIEVVQPSVRKGMHRDDESVLDISNQVFAGYAIQDYRHSDEENFDDLKDRAEKALKSLENHHSNRICVVTHGLFMRVLLAVALHGEHLTGSVFQDMMRAMNTSNTNVSHFIFKQDPFMKEPHMRWYIEQWNDSNHLG